MENFTNSILPAKLKTLLSEIIHLALSDEKAFAQLVIHFSRLNLSTKVTYQQWSAFKFHRHSLPLNREQLLADAVLREELLDMAAENLHHMLKRNLTAAHQPTFMQMTAAQLYQLLKIRWVNELSADRIVPELVLMASREASPEGWRRVEEIISSMGQTCKSSP